MHLGLNVVQLAVRTALFVAAILITGSHAALASEPNAPQRGENEGCLDFNVSYLIPGVHITSIKVAGGTGFIAEQSGGTQIYVDFYDATGTWIGDNSRNRTHTPEAATAGTVCVGSIGGGWPDLPANGATWTYQDGF